MVPDHELFEKNDYEGILKKYEPLIQSESLKQYKNQCDKAEEFEDVLQFNRLICYKYILYIKSKKDINFRYGATFGPFLKQQLHTYYLAKVRKKRNRVHNYLSSIHDFNDGEPIFLTIDNFEFDCCFKDFLKMLTIEEKKFINAFSFCKSCNKTANFLNTSQSYTIRMRKYLKQKYIHYFFEGIF